MAGRADRIEGGMKMAILTPLKIQEEKLEESKFRLAHMVSQRAKMIMQGKKPLVETSYFKPITIALQEIEEEKVACYSPEEAKQIHEEMEKRLKEQEETELKALQQKQKTASSEKAKKETEESA
jgi:DNA-directed RNA polymerase omega subunit